MSNHQWMIEVLADLELYAVENDMRDLADQLRHCQGFAAAQFVETKDAKKENILPLIAHS